MTVGYRFLVSAELPSARMRIRGGAVKVSIKFTDLQAFTSDDPDTVPTTQAEKERIVQVLNHHRSERADTGPDGFPASDVSRDESRMSGIPR